MRPLTYAILRLLGDGRFHSGSTLAASLQVSRTAIWEALAEAQAHLPIFRVRGRGYQLAEAVEWLDPTKISGDWQVELVNEIPSTNAHLTSLGEAAHGRCLITEHQTAGRGRRGRQWLAPLGGALAFSVGWRFAGPPAELSGLSLVVGLALYRALRAFGVSDVQVKWPNDLLRQGRKLAGILIEVQGETSGPSQVTIGIGLNLKLPAEFQRAVDQAVTDLADLPQPIDRNHLLSVILGELSTALRQFAQVGFAPLVAAFNAAHAFHGKAVDMLLPDGSRLAATTDGVSPRGGLLVTTADGRRELTVGEISLRPAS